ncbi:MAG: DUF975 family protein [Ruminococcaceae bacterium]|nr:DUF975 family protein [Oscillospiraceae bacterium]
MNNQYQTPFRRRSSAADFRNTARAALKNRWVLAICAFVLACLLGMSAGSVSFSNKEDTSSTPGNSVTEEVLQQYRNHMFAISALMEEGNFSDAVGYAVENVIGVAALIGMLIATLFAFGYAIFVGSPTTVGYHRFNLDLIDGKSELSVGTLFYGFKHCYFKSIGVHLLVELIQFAVNVVAAVGLAISVAFLFGMPVIGALMLLGVLVLYVVASIVITYRYALCNFILAEYPQLGVMDVLRNSASLMKGNKFRLFCLNFSFFGWILLAACCTCGLGLLVVSPYAYAANAAFYYEITGHDTAKDVEFPSVNPDDYFPEL